MLKQKKYDWKDTNMALFGSDLEKKIKKAAAQGVRVIVIIVHIV
jgi:gelsolin